VPHPLPQGATVYSVAEAAGVSIATVSRVFRRPEAVSAKTRAKVLDAASRLNYVPLGAARSLAVRHHEASGLVLPELRGPYYSELLMGFEARTAELGHSVVLALADGKHDLDQTVRGLASRVDGLAVLGAGGLPAAVLATLGAAKPIVIIAGDPLPGTDAIGAENTSSARELTDHLMEHGRSRMLFLGRPDLAPDVRDRYQGFRQAHLARGLDVPEPVALSFAEADGAGFAASLLAGDHSADALVCANDELALAVMDRLLRHGVRVPDDVAVVGWDDVMAARYVRPGLTTVRQPVRAIGELVATRLRERVNGAALAQAPVRLATHLVLRASCGCVEPDAASSGDGPCGCPAHRK
jgi:LacI family transcriptional regulator